MKGSANRRVHPLVYLDYRVRILGHLIVAVILASIFLDRRESTALWAAMIAQVLLWPHLAFIHARNSRDSKRTELTNLCIDGFIIGCWVALVSFSPWPTMTFAAALIPAFLSVGGLRFSLLAVLAMVIGSLTMGAITGFRLEPSSSALTMSLSIGGILAYASTFGLVTNRQARRILQSNKTIAAQAAEIQHRTALAEQAREGAERRAHDLAEALTQQTATSEVLSTISRSPTSVEPVLNAVAEHVARLCGAADVLIFRLEGGVLRSAAGSGTLARAPIGEDVVPVDRGSVTGRSVVDRRVVHVHDMAAEPDTEYPVGKRYQRLVGLRTMLGAPLLQEGVPIGTILLRRTEARPFSEAEIERVKTFADQAAIALHTVHMFEQLEARRHELAESLEEVRALADVTTVISGSLDLQQVLDTLIRHAVKLADSDAGAIFQFDPASRSFTGIASHGLPAEFLEEIKATAVDPTKGVIRRATETGQPFQIPEIEAAHEYWFREQTLRAGFHALLAAPIPSTNITRGITVFRRAGGRFDQRVVDLVVALANQSKVAIDNARLFQEVENQRLQLERLSRDIEHLYRLSSALQEPLSLKEQLHRVLEAASQKGIIDRIYIWAVDPEGTKLVNLVGAGFAEDEWKDFEGTEIPLAQAGAMGKAYRDGVALVFNEANPLPPELALRPPYSKLRAIRTQNFLAIPMAARGTTVGLLTGDNKWSGRPLLPETVALLQTFASHAAVAIANARLFQAIEEKSQQLEVATRHKSQFLANMSHELRTPLNAIIGYTELMADGIYGEMPEQMREVLQRVDQAGRHLLGLINDVLDLSKIEAGQLTLSLAHYSMAEVVQSVALAVEPLATEKALALRVDIPPEVPFGLGDELRLRQVVLNLAGNAVKFTDAGAVAITLGVADGTVTVSVSDTGPGIAAADRDRIFEEFQQASGSVARKKGGTGLGLAIALRIVEMHGGRLWVDSVPGQGSTFTFTVPLRVERRSRQVPVPVERRGAA